jgi:hypothetical protein
MTLTTVLLIAFPTNIPLTANQCLPTPHLDLSVSDHPSANLTIPAANKNDHHNNRDNTNGVTVADATNGNDVSTISYNRNVNNYNHLPARHLHLHFNGIPQPLTMMKLHILHHWITSLLISPLHHPTNADSELLKFITKLKHRQRKMQLPSCDILKNQKNLTDRSKN